MIIFFIWYIAIGSSVIFFMNKQAPAGVLFWVVTMVFWPMMIVIAAIICRTVDHENAKQEQQHQLDSGNADSKLD